jgi:hypothetical protein
MFIDSKTFRQCIESGSPNIVTDTIEMKIFFLLTSIEWSFTLASYNVFKFFMLTDLFLKR